MFVSLPFLFQILDLPLCISFSLLPLHPQKEKVSTERQKLGSAKMLIKSTVCVCSARRCWAVQESWISSVSLNLAIWPNIHIHARNKLYSHHHNAIILIEINLFRRFKINWIINWLIYKMMDQTSIYADMLSSMWNMWKTIAFKYCRSLVLAKKSLPVLQRLS